MTFPFLPFTPTLFGVKALELPYAAMVATLIFIFFAATTLHYVLTFDDQCGSQKLMLDIINLLNYVLLLLHMIACATSVLVFPGIIFYIPIFVTIFMFAYMWWVGALLVVQVLRVWGCLCGKAKYWGFFLHIIGFILPLFYLYLACVINTYAEDMLA